MWLSYQSCRTSNCAFVQFELRFGSWKSCRHQPRFGLTADLCRRVRLNNHLVSAPKIPESWDARVSSNTSVLERLPASLD